MRMKNRLKCFEVYISCNCSNNKNLKMINEFTINFDKIFIKIKNNTLDNILNAIYESIERETDVSIESFNITRFSTDDVNKLLSISKNEQLLKYNIENLSSCYACHQKSPIFRIRGFYDCEELYLCKKHLRQLYNFLNGINSRYELIIKPACSYDVSVKD